MRLYTWPIALRVVVLAVLSCATSGAQEVTSINVKGGVTIPRLTSAPRLEDFVGEGLSDISDRMVKISAFIQRSPIDGAPASEATEAYLGYDDKNFYVVFVCAQEKRDLRARLARREDTDADDNVELLLDTFHDRRRAYSFMVNPRGVQTDSLWSEGQDERNLSFDTVWYSKTRVTDNGYVVLMSVPFRSLRFPRTEAQTWGIQLHRFMPAHDEDSYWPRYTNRIEGRLNQAGEVTGLREISPGRNMQFIPYTLVRSYRAMDLRDPAEPRFAEKTIKADFGLDSKFIFKDSLVLDLTVNPDFSQVESDEPQITVNQRFEVFFPEKRPFFLENSNYFDTQVNYVFTRRIADPEYGARLTGKVGKYSLGFMVADDRSPGLLVPPSDPLANTRAVFVIGRLTRDIGSQSTIGLLYTDREYEGTFNRVGGIDGRIKLNQNWVGSFQGVVSSTKSWYGYFAGPSLSAAITRSGRRFNYNFQVDDTAAGFVTETGFFRRPNYRRFEQDVSFKFWPGKKWLISHGPAFILLRGYDHNGFGLMEENTVSYRVDMPRTTYFIGHYAFGREGLRQDEYPALPGNTRLSYYNYGLQYNCDPFKWLGVFVAVRSSKQVNYVVPQNVAPYMLRDFSAPYVGVWLRPTTSLKVSGNYVYDRAVDPNVKQVAFTNHIIRNTWNWQFNPEMSVRFIGQYTAVLPSTTLTTLKPTKSFNADFLFTYLMHPGTAVYVGYNSNVENLTPNLALDPEGSLTRTRNSFINNGRQFFIKMSYLFR
jgi:hypothetical protein